MENQTVTTTAPAPLTLDTPDLSVAEYRALREGRDVVRAAAETPVTETPVAEAATPDAETAVEGETEQESTEESKQEPAAKPAKKDGLQSRFTELTAQVKELKAQLAQKATPAEPPKPAAAESQQTSNDPEPDASKFDSYVEWQKAWMRWDRRQEARAEHARTAETAKQTAAAARNESWNSRVTEAKAEFSDFDQVAMNRDLPVTPVMASAIQESDLGPQVLYHLGQHPAEAARIAKLSPASQVRELGKLEAKLEAETAAATAKETPQHKATPVSKAPAPLRPISGAAAASASAKAIESMSLSEYRALRESGKLR